MPKFSHLDCPPKFSKKKQPYPLTPLAPHGKKLHFRNSSQTIAHPLFHIAAQLTYPFLHLAVWLAFRSPARPSKIAVQDSHLAVQSAVVRICLLDEIGRAHV